MNRKRVGQILVGAALAGVLLWAARSASPSKVMFAAALPPRARPYADVILRVSRETGVPAHLLYAIGDRESRWGTALDSGGRGDNGNGHGIMQIDKRYHGAWIAQDKWRDPYENVKYGAKVLLDSLNYMSRKGLKGVTRDFAAVAAYNKGASGVYQNVVAGRSADTGTTGNDYASDVIARANQIVSAIRGLS
jgi:soluble lytic murein transglycosylase-like protein